MHLPLNGITVLELGKNMTVPLAGLRLADLGARVIKLEPLPNGDMLRKLAMKNEWLGDSSLLFHTINRNKESVAVDFNDPSDHEFIYKLIAKTDVLIHNYSPKETAAWGFDYPVVKNINERIIYASISGFGSEGPWAAKPTNDLLAQALSGLAYATGNKQDDPMPFGLGIADNVCSNQSVMAILAALIRRNKTGEGALLELSLIESLLDFQFEFLTTYFQSREQHQRSEINNGHALLSAPYGIYKTKDGYIAVAMMPIGKLNKVIQSKELEGYDEKDSFDKRDEIKKILATYFLANTTDGWLAKMRIHDLWVMPVLDWEQLVHSPNYQVLKIEQLVLDTENNLTTTRCPFRINKQLILSNKPAPKLGEQTLKIKELFLVK